MTRYLVCIEGDEDEIDDASTVEADDRQDAAEEYVRINYAELDYPDEIDVFVKPQGTAAVLIKFNVQAVPTVNFRAKLTH